MRLLTILVFSIVVALAFASDYEEDQAEEKELQDSLNNENMAMPEDNEDLMFEDSFENLEYPENKYVASWYLLIATTMGLEAFIIHTCCVDKESLIALEIYIYILVTL